MLTSKAGKILNGANFACLSELVSLITVDQFV